MDKIYIVIVTYNGSKWLKRCLTSLSASTLKSEIIIVDNNSSDDSVQIIEANFPEIVILKQTHNLGFGKANNIGISYALKQGARSIFLLNQDAYVESETLSALMKVSQQNKDFGILSPVQLNWEGIQLEYYFSKFIEKNAQFYSDYFLNNAKQDIYEVPFVNAAAWFIPRHVFESIGGFDPIFHHYGEDNNFCQRLTYHGFKIGVVPKSLIYHDSIKRTEPEKYLFSQSYYLNEVKQLQIKYANINESFTKKDQKNVKSHIVKLIILNFLKFNWTGVKVYIKKYKIFETALSQIAQSRSINVNKNPHYLDF